MEHLLRAALIDWLRGDPVLTGRLNAISEEAPVAATPPWLGIAASASTDWSVKNRTGREVRIALELTDRQDEAAAMAVTTQYIEERIATFAPEQDGFECPGIHFLRGRAEQRPRNLRTALLEYRFRILAN